MQNVRTGLGYDSHRIEEGRILVIGGIEIPYHKGSIAHSDGDVLIHALCDALLGALALGDIGTHFPDNDPQYRNADSKQLLRHVVELIHQQGWKVNNIDTTLILEEPKMKPYIPLMTEVLASLVQIPVSSFSIKAKTNEKMGPIGNKEGIAAIAIVTLVN